MGQGDASPRQIKYDPISRFAPRNNAIDLLFPYRRCHATRRTDNLRGRGYRDGSRRGGSGMKKLKAGGGGAAMRRGGTARDVRSDLHKTPRGMYRATNVGRSTCTSRREESRCSQRCSQRDERAEIETSQWRTSVQPRLIRTRIIKKLATVFFLFFLHLLLLFLFSTLLCSLGFAIRAATPPPD